MYSAFIQYWHDPKKVLFATQADSLPDVIRNVIAFVEKLETRRKDDHVVIYYRKGRGPKQVRELSRMHLPEHCKAHYEARLELLADQPKRQERNFFTYSTRYIPFDAWPFGKTPHPTTGPGPDEMEAESTHIQNR